MIYAVDALNKARTIFSRHMNEIQHIFSEYQKDVAATSSYSADYAKQKKEEARATAKGKIVHADRSMNEAIKDLLPIMRESIYDAVTQPPRPDFMDSMRAYHDLGLRMTETEIRGFAEQAADCHIEMRVLGRVAEKSGFEIKIPSVEAIEADIARIEKASWIPTTYVPPVYKSEAVEIGGKIPYFRNDGTVASWLNDIDLRYLAIRGGQREKLLDDMEKDMLERWRNVQPVTVTKAHLEAEADAKTRSITEAETRMQYAEGLEVQNDAAEANAAAIEAANAESVARSKDILARYIAGK